LEYHHFDPPWNIEHHHRPEGLIPLCPTHHGQADAFTVDQLRHFKTAAHQRPAVGRFEWLRRELVGALGGGLYHETPVLVQLGSEPVIWFNRDEFGHALLNVRMLTMSSEERMCIYDNDFAVLGNPTDFESPPSGHRLMVRYGNGDYLRIEFREVRSLDAACRKFVHVRPDYIASIANHWPMTFVLITMKVRNTSIQFGPTMTRLPGIRMKGFVSSHNPVGLSLGTTDHAQENVRMMTNDKTYEDKIIYLTDLLNKRERPPKLEGFTFTRCQIRGPVVVYPMGGTISGCHFHNDAEAMLYEVPEGSTKVGIVGLVDCTFTDCDIESVGFAGTPAQLDQIRSVLG